MAGNCLSFALKNAVIHAAGQDRIFNPANWVKDKQNLADITATILPTLNVYETIDKNVYDDLKAS